VQVLTNVGLEHTRWLGPTITDIAREKLDVVRPGSVLVLGADLHPDAVAVATETAQERGTRIVRAPAEPPDGVVLRAGGAFQRRNFALARSAAEAFVGRTLDPDAVCAAASELVIPGRFQVLDGDVVLDGAHNPGGIAALVESLPAFLAGRPLTAVVSILDDKDAAAMLSELLPLCERVICTSCANPRALSPATLESLARQLGGPPASVDPDPRRALEQARGYGGVVLATGSIYLIADLLRPPSAGRGSIL
jgi:dihydrofolate synthase/folylpolyglutamate synthase